MDRDIHVYSTAGYEFHSEWAWINKNLLAYVRPVPGDPPNGIVRGGNKLQLNNSVPGIWGSPWGGGAWYFGTGGKYVHYPFLEEHFTDMAGEDFTVATLIRVGDTGAQYWKDGWTLRLITSPATTYVLRYTTEWLAYLSQPGPQSMAQAMDTEDRWIATAVATSPSEGYWEMFASDAETGEVLASKSSTLGWHQLDYRTYGIHLGTTAVHATKAPFHTIGCFFIVKGAWDEQQFLHWAGDPMAWARRSNIIAPTVRPIGCPVSEVEIFPAVSGDIEITEAVNSAVEVGVAVDADVDIGPAVDSDVDIGIAVDGDVEISPAVDAEVELNPAVDSDVELGAAVDSAVEIGQAVSGSIEIGSAVSANVSIFPAVSGDIEICEAD